MDLATSIARRIIELEHSLDRALADGTDPDSYNVGWLDGGLHALRALTAIDGQRNTLDRD
jgi:hypothetical protein